MIPASIRGRLLGLLLLAALPALALVCIGALLAWAEAERTTLRDLREERDRLLAAETVSRQAADALLATLAAALPDDPALACAMLAGQGAPLRLLDARGAPACAAPPAPLPAPAWFAAIAGGAARAVAPGEAGGLVLAAARPGGGALAMEIPPGPGAPGLHRWLVDAAGAARGPPGSPPPAGPLPEAEAFSFETRDGKRLLGVSAPLAPGLRLVLARPEGSARAAALRQGALHLAEMLAMLALVAASVALGAMRLVTRPLERLEVAVTRWRAGGAELAIEGKAAMPRELRALAESLEESATALSAREAELRAAMERGELLAAEIHHRVKNNFQVVSSLLALQAGRITDAAARAEFESARDRIGALATLHRHMYVHHDPEAIDLGAFIRELGEQLFAAVGERPGRRIALEVEAPALRMSADQAVPLALIITETLSGLLKNAFPGLRRGRILITVAAGAGRARLCIRDDGTELAEGQGRSGLGAVLLGGLARQLGGSLARQAGAEGSELTLDFPLRAPLPLGTASLKAGTGQPQG